MNEVFENAEAHAGERQQQWSAVMRNVIRQLCSSLNRFWLN